jgi:hypothetical protein
VNVAKRYSNGQIYSAYNGGPGADDMPSEYVSSADYRALAAELADYRGRLTTACGDLIVKQNRITALEAALGTAAQHIRMADKNTGEENDAMWLTLQDVLSRTAAETACTTCGQYGRGDGFCSNSYHLDFPAETSVQHAPTCPVSRPGFVLIEGLQQCNCDFGRLGEGARNAVH